MAQEKVPAEFFYEQILQVEDEFTRDILLAQFCEKYFPEVYRVLKGTPKK